MADSTPDDDGNAEESLADTEAEIAEIQKGDDGGDESLADTETDLAELEEADENE